MNKNYTEIAFILDRSGSMESCRDAAIAGFNRFLHQQQNTDGLARLTLVLFDNEYLVPVRSIPAPEVLPLNTDTYVPRNCTALLDAIGRTIADLGEHLAVIPAAARPAQVIVAILTDGLENASELHTWADIAAQIKHQTEKYKWSFLFLGANQDAIATAAQLNIGADNAATYMADEVGAKSAQVAFSRKVHAMRRRGMGVASVQENLDAVASMSELVGEEDQRERQKD